VRPPRKKHSDSAAGRREFCELVTLHLLRGGLRAFDCRRLRSTRLLEFESPPNKLYAKSKP